MSGYNITVFRFHLPAAHTFFAEVTDLTAGGVVDTLSLLHGGAHGRVHAVFLLVAFVFF